MKPHMLRDAGCTIAATALLFYLLHLAEMYLDSYLVQILSLVAINAILAVSLNLIYGFTGMFSLGHAGFMAIGAYVCALLILPSEQKEMQWILEDIHPWLGDLSMSFLAAVIISGLVAAFFGLLIALPVLRLGGDYLGIATLGFAEIIRVLITNMTPFTNGALGIKGIPQHATLWINYGWLIFTLYFLVVLLRSNVGNVLKATRDDEIAAKVMGVNTFFYRVLSFSLGSFFAGVGGALLGTMLSTVDPKMFNIMLTFNVLMIVVAGGLGSITGSVIGSIVITIMLEWLRFIESPMLLFGWEMPGIPGMRMVVFSLLLLVIIIFRPSGLMGNREFSWNAVFRTRRSQG